MRGARQLAVLLLAVLCALTMAPAAARPARYFISPTGSDASRTCSRTAPCKTWQRADNLLTRPGDTLYARGGMYTGQYNGTWKSASGNAAAKITFRNYPGETPVFDGGGASKYFMAIVGQDHIVIDGLTVQNYKGVSGIWIGYPGSGTNWASFDAIRNTTFRNMGDHPYWDHAIYLSYGVTDVIVENNRIFNTSGAGITSGHGPGLQRGEIRNNVIVDANYGMHFRDGGRDIHIYNNVVGNVSYQGCIDIQRGGDGETGDLGNYDSVIRNNMLFDCTGATGGIDSTGATSPVASHNLFWNVSSNPGPAGAGTSAITADPLFVNPARKDFRLRPGSPAIHSGTSSGAPAFDADGLARPRTSVDRGAHVFRRAAYEDPAARRSAQSISASVRALMFARSTRTVFEELLPGGSLPATHTK